MEVLYLNQKPMTRHILPGGIGLVLALTVGETPFVDTADYIVGAIVLVCCWLVTSGMYFFPVLFNKMPVKDEGLIGRMVFKIYKDHGAAWVRIIFVWRSVVISQVEFLCVLMLLARFVRFTGANWTWVMWYIPASVCVHTLIEWKTLGMHPVILDTICDPRRGCRGGGR